MADTDLSDAIESAFGSPDHKRARAALNKSTTVPIGDADSPSDEELMLLDFSRSVPPSKGRRILISPDSVDSFDTEASSSGLLSPRREVAIENELDMQSVDELKERIREYREIIMKMQRESQSMYTRFESESDRLLQRQVEKLTGRITDAHLGGAGSPTAGSGGSGDPLVKFVLPDDIKAIRVWTDSDGLYLNRISAQFVGESNDRWHEYDDVLVESKRDETLVDIPDFEIDSLDHHDYFAGVIEEIHDSSLSVSSSTAGGLPIIRSDSEAKLPETGTMREAITWLQDLEKAGTEEDLADDARKAHTHARGLRKSGAGDSLIFTSWAGDSGIFTRGQTIHVLRGITSAPSLHAADFYLTLRERFEDKRPIRVLCLDGGGLRASLSVQLLREIEKGAGDVPINQCFDLIMGTSAGGMFAIELGKLGWKAEQCDALVEKLGKNHFQKKKGGLSKLRKLASESQVYDTDAFRRDIKQGFFGKGKDIPMRGRGVDGTAHVGVTAVRTDFVPWRPYVFRSYDFKRHISCFEGTCNLSVVEAASGTTAAPILMKPLKIKASRLHSKESALLGRVVKEDQMSTFLDGGVYANNPSIAAFFEAKQLYGYEKEIIMVSIGTGHLPKQYNQHASSGWMKMSGELAWGMFETKEVMATNLLRQLMGEDVNYFRFDMTVERDENDRASMIPYFRKRAKAWLRKNEAKKAQLQALGRFCAKYADSPLKEEIDQSVLPIPDLSSASVSGSTSTSGSASAASSPTK